MLNQLPLPSRALPPASRGAASFAAAAEGELHSWAASLTAGLSRWLAALASLLGTLFAALVWLWRSRAGRVARWLVVHAAVGALCVAVLLGMAQLLLHVLVIAFVNITPYTG